MSWHSAQAWEASWRALGVSPDMSLLDTLLRAYSEPHRSYHTLQHLEECFSKLDELRILTEHAAEIELALWFHDAIYDVTRHDNEERCADWAYASMLAGGIGHEAAQRTRNLILTTRHLGVPGDVDAAILTDLDLAILGAPSDRFDEYEQQIRAEYRHIADDVFIKRRRALLQGFLARTKIFSTLLFHAKYEQQARDNLARSLQRL